MTTEGLAALGAAIAAAAAIAQLDGAGVSWDRAPWRPDGHRRPEPPGAAAGTRRGSGPSGGASTRAPLAGSPRLQLHAVVAIVGACVGLLLAGLIGAPVFGAAAAFGSLWRARRRAGLDRRARERAAPALARSIADALRGGASVRSALAAAADDRSVPAALRASVADFARAVRLGAPVEGSLVTLAACGGPGLRLLCGTVVLHLEAGGPLARELQQLATDGEVALRIDEDRVAATAQARATVRVVAALPVLALLGAELASRDFLPKIVSKPLPLAMLLLGLLLEATAIAAARVIVGSSR